MTSSGSEILNQVLKSDRRGPRGCRGAETGIDHQRLQDAAEPCRDDCGAGGRRRVHRQAARVGHPHGGQQHDGPQHVGRNERDAHPGVAAPYAVLHVRQRVKRNANEGEIDRQDELALDVILKEPDAEQAERHDERAAAERHKPDAPYQSSQVVEIAGLAINRREPDRCEVQS